MSPNSSVFSKPKVVIPAAFVIALALGAYMLPRIGKAPAVSDLGAATPAGVTMNAGTLSLSFNASGRVASVAVKQGDSVSKGETLATLDTAAAAAAVSQAKGALDLAKAQFGSMSVQYTNAQSTQDLLVKNAYNILLSSGLAAFPIGVNDEAHNPIISGTYTCGKEGDYEIVPYASGTTSGYSFNVHGLEEMSGGEVTYGTPEPLGSCGLLVTFVQGFVPSSKWTVSIPNEKSPSYQANKNAYDLAVSTRAQTLSQLAANLGANGSQSADVAGAAITAAQGAYDAAVAALQNDAIVAPASGTVSFIDTTLKVGQSVSAGRPVISITPR